MKLSFVIITGAKTSGFEQQRQRRQRFISLSGRSREEGKKEGRGWFRQIGRLLLSITLHRVAK
jgi:hypothetical protein